jgi:hypothetical protein
MISRARAYRARRTDSKSTRTAGSVQTDTAPRVSAAEPSSVELYDPATPRCCTSSAVAPVLLEPETPASVSAESSYTPVSPGAAENTGPEPTASDSEHSYAWEAIARIEEVLDPAAAQAAAAYEAQLFMAFLAAKGQRAGLLMLAELVLESGWFKVLRRDASRATLLDEIARLLVMQALKNEDARVACEFLREHFMRVIDTLAAHNFRAPDPVNVLLRFRSPPPSASGEFPRFGRAWRECPEYLPRPFARDPDPRLARRDTTIVTPAPAPAPTSTGMESPRIARGPAGSGFYPRSSTDWITAEVIERVILSCGCSHRVGRGRASSIDWSLLRAAANSAKRQTHFRKELASVFDHDYALRSRIDTLPPLPAGHTPVVEALREPRVCSACRQPGAAVRLIGTHKAWHPRCLLRECVGAPRQ